MEIRWHLNELMVAYRKATGEPLLAVHLAKAAGLAPSTIHYMTHQFPVRIELRSVGLLLAFFSQALGPLTTQDLIEFVNQPEE